MSLSTSERYSQGFNTLNQDLTPLLAIIVVEKAQLEFLENLIQMIWRQCERKES
jgi:hypothetical protein